MKLGTEDRRKLAIAAVAGIGGIAAIVYAYGQLFPSIPSSVAPPAQVVVAPATTTQSARSSGTSSGGNSARVLGTTAASLDPTLHMNAMLVTEALTYRGSGRNIFSSSAAQISVPKPVSSARPKQTVVAYTPPAGPPPPPPINLRFFGTATRTGQPARAFLLRGDDVVLASIGDIVERRYKVLSITANAVTVEDLTNERQQSLPLLAN